jgi:hypothetical protein
VPQLGPKPPVVLQQVQLHIGHGGVCIFAWFLQDQLVLLWASQFFSLHDEHMGTGLVHHFDG